MTPQKKVKYKFFYLNEPEGRKKLKTLMEEASVGDIVEYDRPKDIEAELKEHLSNGWFLRAKTELKDWGYLLFMAKNEKTK